MQNFNENFFKKAVCGDCCNTKKKKRHFKEALIYFANIIIVYAFEHLTNESLLIMIFLRILEISTAFAENDVKIIIYK